jgi:SAM-dependent methyltransferase
MTQESDSLMDLNLWDEAAAGTYDTPGEGMFSDEVLLPTVDFLERLAEGQDALEFAIGTGRVAIPLSRRGIRVSGIDYSEAMVADLHRKAGKEAIPVIVGNMATTKVVGDFALVYLVFNGISNLLTQEAQVQCFRNAASHLRKGGRFVVELWVPELRKLPPGQKAVVWEERPGFIGLDTYDLLAQHVVSHHFSFDGGEDARIRRTEHRYVWPSELDLMARLAGFELEHRYSDWKGSAFDAESRSHVSVYRTS